MVRAIFQELHKRWRKRRLRLLNSSHSVSTPLGYVPYESEWLDTALLEGMRRAKRTKCYLPHIVEDQ